MWTFADNLAFAEHYDLYRHDSEGIAVFESVRSRPTMDSHVAVASLRRAWDVLDPRKIELTLVRTYRAHKNRNQPPRLEWLALGLAALPEDLWLPPATVEEFVHEIAVSVDGEDDFVDALTMWLQDQNPTKVAEVVSWF